ncbi:carboxypeptidase-like regulatory domain-containing protein [Niabella ginsengisoli]|uniref:Carboxypeptidase-like regulatory domain-containing protein n=1 Tax=Niabella ginsengisoli TaxID=522298 RepID=A0ABS9SGV4_9BACT|nr:carboxypeptidase-like regulatory domain-containing protein [Niabella ginsengisoli]MCH5597570.1 carboxypeptidase-like regulatory domain-containing protein [Niabella ginsengisoli]
MLFYAFLFVSFLCSSGQADNKIKVTGTISDSSGAALAGVSVSIKNNIASGTQTNTDGQYILEAPRGSVLVYSFVGYGDEERTVDVTDSALVINVVLFSKGAEMDEVVTVAYGTQKKEN